MHTLRILHLSDLHARGPREDEQWRRQRTLGSAWDDNLRQIADAGAIDLICLTGDIANQGRTDEYVEATAFVERLLEHLDLPRDRFFCVPGNHDVDRTIAGAEWGAMRAGLTAVDALALSRALAAGGAAGPGMPEVDQILARTGAYRDWLSVIRREELVPSQSPHGRLGYRRTIHVRDLPFAVHVIGLDSAWSSGDAADAGRLVLSQDQVMRLATDTEGKPLDGLRLALVHHPLHDLRDATECRRLLAEHVDLLLRGHLHDAAAQSWSDPSSRLRELATGSLYEVATSEGRRNRLQVVTLELDPAGRIHGIEIWFRTFSPRDGHWFDDNETYRGTRGGRLRLDADGRPSGASRTRCFFVPLDRNGFFAGREAILRGIEETLARGATAAVTQAQAISGLGGVGKTQVALEFAYRARDRYSDVLWVSAASEDTLRAGFAAIAEQLGIDVAGRDAQAAARAVKLWLEANRGWLLVLDNADEPSQIRPYLPRGGSGHILLTSRAQVLQQLGIAAPLQLNELSPEESLRFLQRRAGREAEADKSEIDAMAALARELGHLPLALEQAAAYIVELQETFANYLRAFKRERLKLLDRAQPIAGDYERSVATTWSLNFRRIEQESPASVALLQVLSFLGADAVPDELIRGGMERWPTPLRDALLGGDALVLGKLLQPLARYSLIRRDRSKETTSTHRLVQDVVREGLDDKAQRALARSVVVALATQFPDPADYRNWPACERFLQHVRAGVRWIEEFDFRFEEAGRLLNQTAFYLEEREEYEEAETLYQRSVAVREHISERDGYTNPNIVAALRNLGVLRMKLGRYADAEVDLRRAVHAAERVAREGRFATDRDILPMALVSLGHILEERGRAQEALPILQRAFAHVEQAPASVLPIDRAQVVRALAGLQRQLGHADEAATLFQKAIELLEHAGPAAVPALADARVGLSEVRLSQGRLADAEVLAARALKQMEQAYGSDHADVAQFVEKIGKVYVEQGRYREAEPLLRRNLDSRRRAHGRASLHTARALDLLADCLRHQSRYDEAQPLYVEAIAVAERTLGPDHHDLIDYITGFALLHMYRGRHDEAERLFARADAINAVRPSPAPVDPMVANNRALLVENRARYQDAAALYREALAQQERLWGPDHPSTALIRHNLAHAEMQRGNYKEAASLAEQALAIWQRTLGPDHHHVARGCDTLAGLRLQLGDAATAERLWRQGLSIRERIFGSDHVEIAGSLYQIALLHRVRGDRAGAEPLLRRALEISEQREPESDLHATIMLTLAETLSEVDQLDEAERLFDRALALRRRLYKAPHPKLAHALVAWAGHLVHVGRRDEAATHLRQALAETERLQGPTHPEVATILHNIAVVELQGENLTEAEALERRAVEIRTRTLGEDHDDTAFARAHLGQIMAAGGDYREAYRHIESVVAQYREAPPINARARLGALVQSLEPALRMGQYAEVCRRGEEALALIPVDDPSAPIIRGKLLSSIGHALLKQADWPRAERALRESLELLAGKPGNDADEVAPILVGIAETRRQQRDLPQARELAERALAMMQSQAAPDRNALASAHNVLGGVLEHLREYDAAEQEYHRAVELAGNDPMGELMGAMAANNLANVLSFKGRADEAIARFDQARQILERRLGADHPEVAQILFNGGLRLVQSGRPEEGLPMLRDAARISAAALGPAHPTTRLIHRGLGEELLAANDPAGARAAFELVLAGAPPATKADHDQVMRDRLHLADALEQLDDWPAARVQREHLLNWAEAQQGADSELAATARIAAGNACLVGGDAPAASEHLERALPVARLRITNKVFFATALNNAGVALNALGDTARARERFEETVATHEALGDRTEGRVGALVHLAQALDVDGDHDAAEARRREAFALVTGGVEVWPKVLVAIVDELVEPLVGRHDVAGARALIDEALACTASLDDNGREALRRRREELAPT